LAGLVILNNYWLKPKPYESSFGMRKAVKSLGQEKDNLTASESGVISIEFLFLFPFFILILVGLMEFGHLWNVRHAITNAGREAARAAVVAPPANTPDRRTWAAAAVNESLKNTGFNLDDNGTATLSYLPNVIFHVTAVAGINTGDAVTVTITASNIVLWLSDVIPAFKNVSFASQTTMRME
jgi:Flp pilus assembly protein TadG